MHATWHNPFNTPWFYHPNYIWWYIQVVTILPDLIKKFLLQTFLKKLECVIQKPYVVMGHSVLYRIGRHKLWLGAVFSALFELRIIIFSK
jgi:hypothetical protein